MIETDDPNFEFGDDGTVVAVDACSGLEVALVSGCVSRCSTCCAVSGGPTFPISRLSVGLQGSSDDLPFVDFKRLLGPSSGLGVNSTLVAFTYVVDLRQVFP